MANKEKEEIKLGMKILQYLHEKPIIGIKILQKS